MNGVNETNKTNTSNELFTADKIEAVKQEGRSLVRELSLIHIQMCIRDSHLTDGTKVQRDWYSSYLLYCINKTYTQINKLKCQSNFAFMYQKEKTLIEEIIRSRKKIMNSGIRTV